MVLYCLMLEGDIKQLVAGLWGPLGLVSNMMMGNGKANAEN